jgi:hypothetical protein
LQFDCGQLTLRVLFLNGNLQFSLLVLQLAHFCHSSVLLPHKVIQLFLNLGLPSLIFTQLLLNLKDVLLQTLQCRLDASFIAIHCSQFFIIFGEFRLDLGKGIIEFVLL